MFSRVKVCHSAVAKGMVGILAPNSTGYVKRSPAILIRTIIKMNVQGAGSEFLRNPRLCKEK